MQRSDPKFVTSMLAEVQNIADKFKMEDGYAYQSPFANLEKAKVLQEARIFHDPVRVREDARQCCTIIAQLLHLQTTGQMLTATESTDVFFGVTKLFMSDDASLRRMVYLFIKEMAETCNPDDVIIVTSSLTKDMTCDVDLYRANALRVLARIVDSSMLGAIERYVKQAIVDSGNQVSSAALVSASQLFNSSPENANIVKRWISETQEACLSSNEMVQFHALQLLHQIRAHDRLGVSKLVTQYSQKQLRSPLANVLLVRFTAKLVRDEYRDGKDKQSPLSKAAYQFLESALQHKSEMVVYEAARAICSLPESEPQDLSPAVQVLQLFLSSPKPTVRFASIKTLAEVATVHPRVVSKCNEDLEALISDTNRSIGTLAITTLLKTASQNSVDRLLKQISSFLADIADEYKITVVRSLQHLCLTYPTKHRVIIGFLSNFLREEGGFEFKKTIVSSIITLMNSVPETTETSLVHLCEFIEDCEFTMLSTQILSLLGELGPKTASPARFIRFIYNRIILENSAVRAAAVEALVKFASSVPSLRSSILLLLQRSLVDEDDETRDRAAIAVKVLSLAMEQHPYVPPPDHMDPAAADSEEEAKYADSPADDDVASLIFLQPLPMNFDKLERSIHAYISTPYAMSSPEALTLDKLPIVEDYTDPYTTSKGHPAMDSTITDVTAAATTPGGAAPAREKVDPAAAVYAIPELAALGRVFRSSAPVPLTESETEYVVNCIKHIMPEYVVLQFSVQNTIEDQRLDNVRVSVEGSDDGAIFEVTGEVAADDIKYGSTKHCFTILKRDPEQRLTPTTFTAELHFNVTTVDPSTGEDEGEAFEEEYPLEDLEVATADFMAKVSVPDFRKSWETLGSDNEVLEKFALQFQNLEDAVNAVVGFLGMHPCDGTGTLKEATKSAAKPHMLHLSGVFVGGTNVLARAQLSKDPSSGVVLKIAVRSTDASVSRLVADCIQ
jgi:coatomer protein complex subunit gamma